MKITGIVEINNMQEGSKTGYVVARPVDGALWYYGNYGDDKDRAEKCAMELGNGIVVKYEGQISG